MLTAAQMAARYQSGMASPNTKQKYTDGINALTVSPTALAATQQAQDKYARNTAAAVSSGRMASALNNVSLQQFKDAAINKGANRLQSGAAAAMNKVTAHFNKWAPIYAQASQAAASIPDDGGNNLAKVEAAINVMRKAAGKA